MHLKRILAALLFCFFLTSVIPPQGVYADDLMESKPCTADFEGVSTDKPNIVPPKIGAGAAIVMDAVSGRVLYEKNAYSRRAMASTTKIMTAIVALENGNLDDEVTVSRRAAEIWGSTLGLRSGQKYTLRELLYGMMLSSGNDAAIAVAEHIGGTVENFLDMMNKKAVEIGARNTQFKSPHGLDADGHYSTAFDLALITRYGLNNPVFARIVSTKGTSIPGINLYNTNELLDIYPGADGVKTGYTGKAGRCLVASATKGKWRIISVVLNCSTRYVRAQSSINILDYAFSNFKPYSLLNSGEIVSTLPIIKGIRKEIKIEAIEGITIPLRVDEPDILRKEIILPDALYAPANAGEEVGTIRFYLGDQILAESVLKTAEEVRRKVFWDYYFDIVREWCRIIRVGNAP